MIKKRVRYLLVAAIVILYLAFLTRTYYWDGVLFSLYIEGVHRGEFPANILFHPNHLLYNALGYVLYSAALACKITVRALTVLQIFNVLVSAAASLMLYGLAKRLTQSASIALFCGILFAAGATWWKFSTDADSYILSVLLILLAISFAFRDSPKFIAAAACHTLAMFFHELAVFVYVPVLAAILFQSGRSMRRRLLQCAAYAIGTGLCVAAVYFACYTQADHVAYPTLFRWVTSYASDSGFTHSARQLVGAYLGSYLKLFLGGRLSLIREYLSAVVYLSFLLCAGAIAFAIWFFRHPGTESGEPAGRGVTSLLWIWLAANAIFLAIWDPGSAFHKLFVWPPVMLLLGVYIGKRAALRKRTTAFIALAIAVAAWNFGGFIYPHSHAGADPVLTFAQTIDKQLPKKATIYYRALDPDDWYIRYFAPGNYWDPVNVRDGRVYIVMTDSPPGPVCFETTALEVLGKSPLFAARIDPARRWDLVNSQHNIRLECLKPSASARKRNTGEAAPEILH